ncbi:MAG: DNA-binding response regulator [Labilithrix sp.]|nr:DNA-binding response regulator [Labilithrix sp.]
METSSRSWKILVVDDDRRLRAGIRRWLTLELEQLDVGEAGDVDTALAMLAEETWDLVLLDISFQANGRPKKTGIDGLKELRARNDVVPVVIVSALPAKEYAAAARAAGALAFVQKERLPEELRAVLANVLASRATS